MSKYVTQHPPAVAAGSYLAVALRDKGWTIQDAAQYLGVSRQRLYTVFSDPRHAKLWDCAIEGIPKCSTAIQGELRKARQARPKKHHQRPTAVNVAEFEIGDAVMAQRYVGTLADEGASGFIADIRSRGPNTELLITTDTGEEWVSTEDFHKYFATTGLKTNKEE